MSKDKKILLSGVKPSGELHIGNYFGAIKQFVDLQEDYKCFFMIADYHALNTLQDAKEMKQNIIDIALDYLALGIDPKKSVIFKQSDVSAHTELTWIFDAITSMPYLMRAHAFKDAEAKNKDLNVGTFNYPMLMASDILLYDADVVPVGADQKQHIEITRDTAQKFNNTFQSETFKLPNPLIIEGVSVVPGTDGQKMSKSYKNVIPLFAEDEVIQKLVMSIVTDSSGGRPENVYAIHKLFRDEEYLENLYKEHEGKYRDLKEALAEDIKEFVRPFREKRNELAKNISYVEKILEVGGKEANEIASKKLIEAKKAIGVL